MTDSYHEVVEYNVIITVTGELDEKVTRFKTNGKGILSSFPRFLFRGTSGTIPISHDISSSKLEAEGSRDQIRYLEY